MPTDVTVGHYPQYHSHAPYINMNQGGWATSHSLPAHFPPNPYLMTGPARALDCLPTPNAVMAKGVRNPWAPNLGETYRPAAEATANRHALLLGGASQPYPSGGGIGGGSMIAPSIYGGGGGGSVMSCGSSAYGGQGGYRMDDGWEGSMGRSHVGHAPDLASTAGAIPRRQIGSQSPLNIPMSMGYPSSPMNHARMSPLPPPPPPPSYADIPPPGQAIKRSRSSSQRIKPPSLSSHSHVQGQGQGSYNRERRGSVSIESQGQGQGHGCHECEHKKGGRRLSEGMMPRYEGSPLGPGPRHLHPASGGGDLRRQVSGSSSRSGRSGRGVLVVRDQPGNMID